MDADGRKVPGPRKVVIAIDGPSGTGKSTVARRLAERLGCRYIDTGAMYRALAVLAERRGVSADDPAGLEALLPDLSLEYRDEAGRFRVLLRGEDLTDAIREPGVGENASRCSRHAGVRQALVQMQRDLARGGGVVMEGRDIGSVVLPDADLKIYLDADESVRTERRLRQWGEQGRKASTEDLRRDIRLRDRRDSTRAEAPLVLAEGGVRVDTSRKTVEQVEEEILALLPPPRS